MKLNGEICRERFCRRVELPRADGSSLALTVSPLRLGFHRRLRRRGIFPPRKPTRVARDSSGKPLRDAQGLAVLMPDAENADYLAELDQYNQRVAAMVIVEGLRDDETIEFETAKPTEAGDWPAFADAINTELESAGWSIGDVATLCDHIFRVSNLLDEHVRETTENFTPPAGGAA